VVLRPAPEHQPEDPSAVERKRRHKIEDSQNAIGEERHPLSGTVASVYEIINA